MGRALVRAAVVDYLQGLNPPLPFVGTIYSARNYVDEQDYLPALSTAAQQAAVNGSGAVLVVNLGASTRMRRTNTGRTAVDDTDIHDVVLEMFFATTSGDPVAAQADNDTLCDALVEAIRGDGTLGGRVWSSAEYRGGVKVEPYAPYTDEEGMTVFLPTLVRWEVWEWLAGPAGST